MDGDVPTIPPRIAGEDTLGENRMWLGKGPRGGGAAISGTNVLVLLLEISREWQNSQSSCRVILLCSRREPWLLGSKKRIPESSRLEKTLGLCQDPVVKVIKNASA